VGDDETSDVAPFIMRSAVLIVMLLAHGCSLRVNWRGLYSGRLGQQITDLDESYLDREFIDPYSSSLLRVAWARLYGGTTVLLGLPPHGLDADEVVERTVVLRQSEWETACADALGAPDVWCWQMGHQHAGNAIRVHINNDRTTYCEFSYLPAGWELRTVRRHGLVKRRTSVAR
jgi:hypothetical protein